jgi:hypothetical protein
MSSDPQHNVVGTEVTFDIGDKTIIFDVYMRQNPGLDVIQRRAREQGLLNADNHTRASIKSNRESVRVTMSGPTLDYIYRAIPLGVQLDKRARRRLTLGRVDAYVEAFYKTASPSLPRPHLNGTNIMRLVALLCS